MILDSYCGNGLSTKIIAEQNPDCLVIGLDKSTTRLEKHVPNERSNYRLLRAECETAWVLLNEAGIRLHKHILLYPNPWPKKSHIKRRVHGHPSFPILCLLGGQIELRTNWWLFAEEFKIACELLGIQGSTEILESEVPLTQFEIKFRARHEVIWKYKSWDNC